MSIKLKTLMICVGMSLLCIILIYSLTKLFIITRADDMERRDMAFKMQRAVKAMSYELSTLQNFTTDWAVWDETYLFIQNGNEEYIKLNLTDTTFKTQRIDMIAILDEEGAVLVAKSYDRGQDHPEDIPQEELSQLNLQRLSSPALAAKGNKGVINTRVAPMFVVAVPVVDSLNTLPAKGTLITGRYIDAEEVALLSEITDLSLGGFVKIDRAENQTAISLTDFNPDLIRQSADVSGDEDVLTSNIRILGAPGTTDCFLLKVASPRTLHQESLKLIYFYLASVFVTTSAFGLAIYMLLNRQILGRLVSLTSAVGRIKRFEDVPGDFGIGGKDEIALLAKELGDMMGELRRSHDQLQYLSTHDTLTEVFNRHYYDEYIHRLGSRPAGKAGIIVCDLDGLKLANDMEGHANGDKQIRLLVEILRNSCPEEAHVFRVGGDEFVIIVDQADINELAAICQTISGEADSAPQSDSIIPLSVSLGYAYYGGPPQDVMDVIKEADQMMYREKLFRHQSRRGGLVPTLRSALEARDYITEGHAHRLCGLTLELAKKAGLPQNKLADLQLFAEFHDLGKIGIADNILHKEAPLSLDERKKMQKHSEIGYRIAQSTPDLAPVAELILYHHEWWNGQGYPMGLAGEAIPLECRILTIVDAFDAMTHDRPYRKALSEENALKELQACAGTQFDPHLIELFLGILKPVM